MPLHLNTLELGDGAVANASGYGLVVSNEVVEFYFAGLGRWKSNPGQVRRGNGRCSEEGGREEDQEDDELAVVGEGEVGDGVGQEAAWEVVFGEDVVDGGNQIRVRFEEGMVVVVRRAGEKKTKKVEKKI
ncbi:hypothetical protein F2Q68_00013535 [Brassica cretica]|uniref:Uncharacterized protein n=1 Tax=Brassica cretica TaxID=69181 RepID=A0A8S9HN39_BRACR|nr:hypothetical protein F2Q68_00013535 [Brassica cretica]